MRDFSGSVWHATSTGDTGDWVGKYDAALDIIDESVTESYMDE
jgi:hypothetical protein